MIKISPSLLAADFSRLGDEASKMKQAGADMLHIDVMDGHFVPNISFGAVVMKSLRKVSNLFFDVHLMISDPYRYIDDFKAAGADMITFHIESQSDPYKTIQAIKAHGMKVGIALKPGTHPEVITEFLPLLDMVLVMTVEPGFGGQKFMEDMMPKISFLKQLISAKKLTTEIQVDGGIDSNTIKKASKAGANIFVAGSALFGLDDYTRAVAELRELAVAEEIQHS